MAWERTGNSANIVFYAERPRKPGYKWAEVLGSHIEKVDGVYRKRKTPIFLGTVYEHGHGEIAKFTHEANVGELSSRTVASLVRGALVAKA